MGHALRWRWTIAFSAVACGALALAAGCAREAGRQQPEGASTDRSDPPSKPATADDPNPVAAAVKPLKKFGDRGIADALAFSPDGRLLASGDSLGRVRIWGMPAATEERAFGVREPNFHSTCSLAFAPDSKMLAVAAEHGLGLWDATTGAKIGPLTPATEGFGPLQEVAFSRDGATLASGGWDYKVRIWDVATRQKKAEFRFDIDSVWCVAMSPDGKLVAAGDDVRLVLWDLATETSTVLVTAPQGPNRSIQSVAFAPDGATLASGGSDGKIRLWDVGARREKAVFSGHPKGVQALAFCRGGKVLASGGYDRTLRFWDPATGKQIGDPRPSGNAVTALAVHPEGNCVAMNGDFGAITLWKVPSPE